MYNRVMTTPSDRTWTELYRSFLCAQNEVREAYTSLWVAERDLARGICADGVAKRAAARCDRASSNKYKALADCIQYRLSITQPASGSSAGDLNGDNK